MSTHAIAENLEQIRRRLTEAATRAGRPPGEVRLLAVSKRIPREAIMQAYGGGQRAFGENRVQELQTKVADLPADCQWHFIGRLQRNKVRPVVQLAHWIHSVDSVQLLQRIDRIAGEEGRRPVVLLEINISGEESKSGAEPGQADELLQAALDCRNLDCRGLMTMAPYEASPEQLHRIFAATRALRDRLAEAYSIPLPELSMGMSGDFTEAIAEGATIVRIGTAIFGVRKAEG